MNNECAGLPIREDMYELAGDDLTLNHYRRQLHDAHAGKRCIAQSGHVAEMKRGEKLTFAVWPLVRSRSRLSRLGTAIGMVSAFPVAVLNRERLRPS